MADVEINDVDMEEISADKQKVLYSAYHIYSHILSTITDRVSSISNLIFIFRVVESDRLVPARRPSSTISLMTRTRLLAAPRDPLRYTITTIV